jgi:hypothetical protein
MEDKKIENQKGGGPGTHLGEIHDISEASSYRNADEILRQTLRGDESKGDADERDIAGAVDFDETPRGREESKNDKLGAANQNG